MRDGGIEHSIRVSKGTNFKTISPHVINKASMTKPSSPPSLPPPQPGHSSSSQWNPSSAAPAASFLDQCFLCQQKLLPGKDIYMYKGDRAFCSEECRCRQMFMDDNCSTSSALSSSSSSRDRKEARNRAFAY